MKKYKVQVGKVYAAKVSGTVQPVRIDRDAGTRERRRLNYTGERSRTLHNGWYGTNLQTGRSVRIASAAKLRYEMVQQGTRWVPLGTTPKQAAVQARLQAQANQMRQDGLARGRAADLQQQVQADPVDVARLGRIEAKYSTEQGATEAERAEAEGIARRLYPHQQVDTGPYMSARGNFGAADYGNDD